MCCSIPYGGNYNHRLAICSPDIQTINDRNIRGAMEIRSLMQLCDGRGLMHLDARIQHMCYDSNCYHYHGVWDESGRKSRQSSWVSHAHVRFVVFIELNGTWTVVGKSFANPRRSTECKANWRMLADLDMPAFPQNWIISHFFGCTLVFMVAAGICWSFGSQWKRSTESVRSR